MSLDICNSEEEHFVIPMRCLATGKVHNVECVVDEGLFYGGYTPEYRVFFKDEWEIVRERERKPEERWLAMIAAITGTFVLALILGSIVHILSQ